MAGNSPDGQALHHAAQVTFAHGFGVAMLFGAAVLLANSALVWVRAIEVHPHGPSPTPAPIVEAESVD